MFKNMGLYDRIARAFAGVIIGVLYFAGLIPGTLALILAGVGLIMLATSAVGFCPAYLAFKFSTKPKE